MLEKYESKKVVIETDNQKIFRGKIVDYIPPDYNENGKESIVIDDAHTGRLVELYGCDIKSIDIMN